MEETFEEPIIELERRIEALSGVGDDETTRREREQLQEQLQSLRRTVFSRLTSWQTTLVARHPRRPYTLDYLRLLLDGFEEIRGDRRYSDDPGIICALGSFRGRMVLAVGHQKGRSTKEIPVTLLSLQMIESRYRNQLYCPKTWILNSIILFDGNTLSTLK